MAAVHGEVKGARPAGDPLQAVEVGGRTGHRQVVLDAPEFSCDRKFANVWTFVKFAEKEHEVLDLLTPPKRPGGK